MTAKYKPSEKRIPKAITDENEIEYLLNLHEKDITLSFMMENFGEFNGKVRFHPYDTFTIPPKRYGIEKKNKDSIDTTVGIFIFNKFMIERELVTIFGYVNHELTKGKTSELVDILTKEVVEDNATVAQLATFLIKTQKTMNLCNILSPNQTEKFFSTTSYLKPHKDRLFKEHKEALENGDAAVMEEIEKELLAIAKEYLKDDPSLDLYLSGAKSNWNNDFKNMYVCKGAIRNPDPNAEHQFNIAKSNWNDGVSKEEYHIFANSLAAGPYARAKKTEVGGYWEKLAIAGYQHIVVEDGDCKTKDCKEVVLTKKNADGWMYSMIDDGGTLVELNSKTLKKYLDKKVKIRYSAYCEWNKGGCLCSVCGSSFLKMGVRNAGATMAQVFSKLKNISMKSFHDSTVTTYKIDPDQAFNYMNDK